MEIILTQDVEKLGEKNDLVSVKNGYALNYLIPQGLAIVATPAKKKELAENLKQAAHRLAKLKNEAEARAKELQAVKLTIPMLVGKDGKVYGSVTAVSVANALKEAGHEVDRKKIQLPKNADQPGTFTATLSLHKEVRAEITFTITEKQPD